MKKLINVLVSFVGSGCIIGFLHLRNCFFTETEFMELYFILYTAILFTINYLGDDK